MTRGFSKAIITGNLARDPEVRTTPNGTNVCSFAVAVNYNYKDNTGSLKETVSFLECVAWGKAGEVIKQYARKGSGILVSGRLTQQSWDDKNTGTKRSRVEIVVEDFNFLGGQDRGGNGQGQSGSGEYSTTGTGETNATSTDTDGIIDDIPDEPIDLSEIPF